jgi:cytoskeletal protein CcmA (bactofilin family)
MTTHDTPKTIIAADTEIVGSLKSGSGVQIEGRVGGDVTCAGSALIGAGAVIRGNVSAESVALTGQITGNITARERIDLKQSARAIGDIKAKRLVVEDGVVLVGRVEVNPTGAQIPVPAAIPSAETPPVDRSADESRRGFFGKR